MNVSKGKLFVAGKQYKKRVLPPSAEQVLESVQDELKKLYTMNVMKSKAVSEKDSSFQEFSTKIGNYEDVRCMYLMLKKKFFKLAHAMAYHLPGNSPEACDYDDDDDIVVDG